ncbi:MAG: UDP-N-acetylmuramate--L-alanine ligase, partial [Leptolyngbyaceae cyanobacterium RM2_2_4]|nr:UDP-N-acetylmuramate--L-alanine ligase [Leptolyngbyaceae cyanobacterium RM2_2_4]
MLNSVDFSGRPFHFIGIGGIGMSALAYILAKRKLPVSGSDICLNHITQRLQEQNVHIFWSQDAANLRFFQPSQRLISAAAAPQETGRNGNGQGANGTSKQQELDSTDSTQLQAVLPQVICSTAIDPKNNSEYRAALESGCPIFHRSDLLAALMQDYQSIAVAGTHGKTTTSSMISYLLLQAELDPTIIVGGEVAAWEGNARLGEGPYLVAEADESDGSLVKFSAYVGVITNIELDHPDHYSSLEQVVETFQTFAQRCEILVGSLDCDTVRHKLKPTVSYSLSPELEADYTATDIVYHPNTTEAQVW